MLKVRRYTCTDCGDEHAMKGTRGPLRTRCPDCLAIHENRRVSSGRSAPCAGCGKQLHGGKGALPEGERRCMDCRHLSWDRVCAACQSPFRSKAKSTYCSKRCATSIRLFDPATFRARPCVDCGVDVRGAGNVPICDGCRPTHKLEVRRAKDRRRRAMLHAVASEPYTLAEIAERDGYACGLCGEPVAMGETVPHPDAPTIDHVVPLAGGGDDTRANIWLAHFLCNVRKGTRPLGEGFAGL